MSHYDTSANVTISTLAVLSDYKTYQVSVNISFFLLTLALDNKIFVYEVSKMSKVFIKPDHRIVVQNKCI